MPFATVVILAAGSRNADALGDAEAGPRPLRAAAAGVADGGRAGRRRARTVVVVGGDGPPVPIAELGDAVEIAVQEQPLGTADAVASAAAQIEREGGRDRARRRRAARRGATAAASSDRARSAPARRRRWSRPCSRTRAGYGRVVRDGAGEIVRVVETKVAGDASAAEMEIARSTPAIYAFDGGALLDALDRRRRRQRAGRALSARRPGGAAPRRRARSRRSRSATRRRDGRQRPRSARRGARGGAAPHPASGTCSRASRSCSRRARASTSASMIGADTRDRAVHAAARVRPASAPARRSGRTAPLIDARIGDGVTVVCTRTSSAARSAPARRSARSPTCARTRCCASARRSAPSSRSRTPTSAPARRCRTSPTSATPTSARLQPRRRLDHRQLRRRRQAPHDDRRARRTAASTRRSSRR